MKRITQFLMMMLFVCTVVSNQVNAKEVTSSTVEYMISETCSDGDCMQKWSVGIAPNNRIVYRLVNEDQPTPDGSNYTTPVELSEAEYNALFNDGGVSIRSLDVKQLELKATKASVLLGITSSITIKKAQQTFFAFAATCSEWENNGSTYELEHGVTMQPKIRYCVEQIGPWHFSYTTQSRDFPVPIE